MRFALCLLGTEVLSVELSGPQTPVQPEPVHGVPFGFSGSSGLHAEISPATYEEGGSDGLPLEEAVAMGVRHQEAVGP